MIERNLSDRYRLEGRIGQGGMAVVYSGTDTVLRRRVAIKVLRPELAADGDFVRRFYSEAQHAAKLSHPNIVNIYDVGREGDRYFIVMELVDGATLAEMIEEGPLPEPVAIDFATQICNGLAYAHRQGLLHRDVKPANVLITKDDVVKLSDFGIARAVSGQTMTVTQPGLVMGSVYYISPEQAQGHELDATSDLYSLGIVLYQMLAGKLPYTGDSPITVALKHVSSPVPPLELDDSTISPALAAIVRRLMQKQPRDRFSSAAEVARALREARDDPSATRYDAPLGNGATTVTPVVEARAMPPPKPRPSRFPDRPAAAPPVEPAPATPPPPGALLFARLALIAVALIAAIVAGYVALRPAGPFAPADVTVASVVGQPVERAERTLDGLGLRYTVVDTPSTTVAAHRVIRQDPPGGKPLAPHGVVTLAVSSGLPVVQLVDVRGYSLSDAQRYLRNAKLVPKIVATYDAAAHGTVLGQKPAGGASVPIHATVVLTVSKGLAPVAVPDITSKTLDDATSDLRARGLQLAVAERDASDQIPANVVMSQTPSGGTSVSPNSTVSVTISSGPRPVQAPDETGRLGADAVRDVQSAGLAPRLEYVVEENAPPGTVLAQNPSPATKLKRGASVTLSVAVPGTVPDVSGKIPDDARLLLESAGYKVGNTAFTQEGTEGTVVRTEPGAGTSLRPGETVTLWVSGVSGDSPAPQEQQ